LYKLGLNRNIKFDGLNDPAATPWELQLRKEFPYTHGTTLMGRGEAKRGYLTDYFWHPVRGQPKRVNIEEMREFGSKGIAALCKSTRRAIIVGLDWDIVARDPDAELTPELQSHIDEVKAFFMDCNPNHETFHPDLTGKMLNDLDDLDSGIIVKVFGGDSYDEQSYNVAENVYESDSTGVGADKCVKWDENGKALQPKTITVKRVKSPELKKSVLLADSKLAKLADADLSKAIDPELRKLYNEKLAKADRKAKNPELLEIWARDGASFLAEVNRDGFIDGWWQYAYITSALPHYFPKETVIYLQKFPNSQSVYSESPVYKGLAVIKAAAYSQLWNKSMYENFPMPAGLLQVIGADWAQVKAFVLEWTAKYRGKPGQIAGVAGEGINFQKFENTVDDMKYLETQRMNIEIIASYFNLTMHELGFTENVAKATGRSQEDVQKRKGTLPDCKLFERAANADIIWLHFYDDVMFKFIFDDVLEQERLSTIAREDYKAGLIKKNEARDVADYAPTDDPTGDEFAPKPTSPFGNPNGPGLPENDSNTEPTEPEQEEESGNMKGLEWLEKKKDFQWGLVPEGSYPEGYKATAPLNLRKEVQLPPLEEKYTKMLMRGIPLAIREIDTAVSAAEKQLAIDSFDSLTNKIAAILTKIFVDEMRSGINERTAKNYQAGIIVGSKLAGDEFKPQVEDTMQWLKLFSDAGGKLMSGYVNRQSMQINQAIEDGIKRREGIEPLMKRISTIMEGSNYELERIARTETNSVFTHAEIDAYEKGDVKLVQHSIVLDDRTSDISKDANRGLIHYPHTASMKDGTIQVGTTDGVYRIEDARGLLPLHPNERDDWLPIIPSEYPGGVQSPL